MEPLIQLEPWRQAILFIPLAVCLTVSAVTDLKHRKVFNKVTYPAILGGVVLHGIALGWAGLASGLGMAFGTIVVGVLLLPLIGGAIGGGDIKLVAAIGAFLGLEATLHVLFYSLLLASVLGIVMAAMNGYLGTMLHRLWRFIRGWIFAAAYRTTAVTEPLERDERSKLPFAVPTLFGAVLAYTDPAYSWPQLYALFLGAFRP